MPTHNALHLCVRDDHLRLSDTAVVVAWGGAGSGPVSGHGGAKETVKILKETEKAKENEEM
jgi:hypothetical protein